MKYISYRIEDLELRRTINIGTEKYYLEIVEWSEDEEGVESCYTILMFREEGEGYRLESMGERTLVDDKNEMDLRMLIKLGFDFFRKKL